MDYAFDPPRDCKSGLIAEVPKGLNPSPVRTFACSPEFHSRAVGVRSQSNSERLNSDSVKPALILHVFLIPIQRQLRPHKFPA
jgi:hypothetical protein